LTQHLSEALLSDIPEGKTRGAIGI
jgi:hypothetical protein